MPREFDRSEDVLKWHHILQKSPVSENGVRGRSSPKALLPGRANRRNAAKNTHTKEIFHMNDITSYMIGQTKNILAIDSPTGFTSRAAAYVMDEYRRLGFEPHLTNKGGIFVCVSEGAKPAAADNNAAYSDIAPEKAPILLEAHMDTLGAMVCRINDRGRLMLTAPVSYTHLTLPTN